MNIFFILCGVGVLIFLAEAGYALITWSERTNPFVGSVLDELNEEEYADMLMAPKKVKSKHDKNSKNSPKAVNNKLR